MRISGKYYHHNLLELVENLHPDIDIENQRLQLALLMLGLVA
jgi:hypothetical protein